MPSLYGTGTTYVVTASNLSTLYLGSTSTAITATTYSTNLAGLYGGVYDALPNNAQQLFDLFSNQGNVQFYLTSPNSATIAAYVNLSTGTISIGNYSFNNNTITNTVNGPFNFTTNGYQWNFNTDGTTSFPNYTFPAAGGTAGQVLADDGTGDLYWTTINAGVTDLTAGTGIAISTSTGSITVTNIGVTAATAGSGISVSTSTGTVNIQNTGVLSVSAGTGTYVSTSSGNILIWTTPPALTAYDFGTILAPVSYTLDMGPII